MNPIQLVQTLEEIITLYHELKQDGVFEKLVAAEQAVQSEFATNTKLQDLAKKVSALKF